MNQLFTNNSAKSDIYLGLALLILTPAVAYLIVLAGALPLLFLTIALAWSAFYKLIQGWGELNGIAITKNGLFKIIVSFVLANIFLEACRSFFL